MPFQISPGVAVVEKDFTSIVPSVSTSVGAFAGSFAWGPIDDPILVGSENELVERFGAPTDSNFKSFFTAANFLSYSNAMYVTRVDATAARNAVATLGGYITDADINISSNSGYTTAPTVTFSPPQIPGGVTATGIATLVTTPGPSAIVITVTNPGSGYTAVPTVQLTGGVGGAASVSVLRLTQAGVKVKNVSDYLNTYANNVSNGCGLWAAKFAGARGNGIRVVIIDSNSWSTTSASVRSQFTAAPGTSSFASSKGIVNDEVHVIVYDNSQGTFSGVANSVLEKFAFLSKLTDAKKSDGSNNYYKSVINSSSRYVWWMAHPSTGQLADTTTSTIVGSATTATIAKATSSITGYITGDTLVVSTATSSNLVVGTKVTGTGVADNTFITQVLSGSGGAGNYRVSVSQTVGTAFSLAAMSAGTNRITLTNATAFLTSIANYKSQYDSWTDRDTRKVQVAYTSSSTAHNSTYTLKAIESVGGGTPTSYNFVVGEDLFLGNGTTSDLTILSVARSAWGVSSAQLLSSSSNVLSLLASSVDSTLSGGIDSFTHTDGQIQNSFALYANSEEYDVSLMPLGDVSSTVANFVVSNVAEVRKDCMVFVSPREADGSPILANSSSVADVKAFRSAMNVNSSYAAMDTGAKYQYDRYNDAYRWVPLNGDIAGLCARTDYTADAWFSPGGYTRGIIKNVVKLGFNPKQAERDELYAAGINPVVTFPGQGTILFGDKTLLTKPSAFDRINVRRLFIVLEKAIAIAARYQMFEFNDSFTRAQFKNLVEPFLRDVQGRRGITDFRVKCDENNNTGQVIDSNEFVADIFIKPNRSINFITLNFIAARSSVSFEEIGA